MHFGIPQIFPPQTFSDLSRQDQNKRRLNPEGNVTILPGSRLCHSPTHLNGKRSAIEGHHSHRGARTTGASPSREPCSGASACCGARDQPRQASPPGPAPGDRCSHAAPAVLALDMCAQTNPNPHAQRGTRTRNEAPRERSSYRRQCPRSTAAGGGQRGEAPRQRTARG